jgi:CAAX prenyl protease-like protein
VPVEFGVTAPALAARPTALPWVAPFAVFMVWLAVGPSLQIPQPWESVARVSVPALVLLTVSRDLVFGLRVRRVGLSVLLGLAVFLLWIAPDQLVPGWRSHWLFQNRLTGTVTTSIPPTELADPLVATLRVVRAALLVPILEELFWRGWLPRWIANTAWAQVPLGTYTPFAFLATAALFAVEHGPYWEVGLLCGVIYNAWMWKTRSLGDLVLTHAVTNAALSAFVLVTGQYGYWM